MNANSQLDKGRFLVRNATLFIDRDSVGLVIEIPYNQSNSLSREEAEEKAKSYNCFFIEQKLVGFGSGQLYWRDV